ncbi:hypothetical protein C1645_767657, partial [Glomus cerebriforme]
MSNNNNNTHHYGLTTCHYYNEQSHGYSDNDQYVCVSSSSSKICGDTKNLLHVLL